MIILDAVCNVHNQWRCQTTELGSADCGEEQQAIWKQNAEVSATVDGPGNALPRAHLAVPRWMLHVMNWPWLSVKHRPSQVLVQTAFFNLLLDLVTLKL